MSVKRRSIGGRRPAIGRPATTSLLAVLALFALFANGVPLALFTERARAQDGTTEVPAVAAQATEAQANEVQPNEAQAPEPAPTNPPVSLDPPPEETTPPPVDPPVREPQKVVIGGAPSSANDTAPPPPPDSGAGDAAAAPAPSEPSAVAHNQSNTIQVIWQVQEGCQSYCYGTSQSQWASQQAETTQDATADTTNGSEPSGATAVNQSNTIQFVWQLQIGCVAFCFDTTMDQAATQQADTTQTATAAGGLDAVAVNIGQTIQRVWQSQQGCQIECHNAIATQSLTQGQTTNQSATATAGAGYPAYTGSSREGFLSWLTGFANNIGATIQNVFQYQQAGCLSNCVGGTQAQRAGQRAATTQTAVAGEPPPPPAEAPAVSQPPSEPPAATEPPAAAGEGSAPATVVVGAASARSPAALARDRSRAGQSSVVRSRSGASAEAGSSPPSSPGPAAGGDQLQQASAASATTEVDRSGTDASQGTREPRAGGPPDRSNPYPSISFGETSMRESLGNAGYLPGIAAIALGLAVLAALALFLHVNRRRIRPGI